MRRQLLPVVLAMGVLSLAWPGIASSTTYTITDLGVWGGGGGNNAHSVDVNDSGVAVGTNGTTNHAYRWQGGTFSDLGTLGGSTSAAYGINNSGLIVGTSAGTDSNAHAFSYNGTMNDLGIFKPAGAMGTGGTVAYGVNVTGQMAVTNLVTWMDLTFAEYSYLANADGMIAANLGTGFAEAINDNGITAGFNNGNPLACVWDASGTKTSLLTLGGAKSYAYGINNGGQAAGSAQTAASAYHACVWSNNYAAAPTDLGTFGGSTSVAYDINNSGVVVGGSMIPGSIYHAFAYSGGTMTDLSSNAVVTNMTSAGWTVLSYARGISNTGYIVGNGTIGGATHSFLLAPVPEPSMLLLTATSLVGLLAYAWRKRR